MDGKHVKNLISCGTCGYPLTPEERTSLVEQEGVMVKPTSVVPDVMTKDKALELALEALTPFSTPNWAGTGVDKANEAITAIKQARALDKMADNARELGLDYEPDEWLTGCPECGMDSGCDCDSGTWNPPAASVQGCDFCSHSLYAGTRCKHCGRETASQPAPVQEPVAFFDPQGKGFYWAKPTKITAPVTVDVEPLPLYTTPPTAQRQSARSAWVGLTQQDIDIAFDDTQEGGGFDEFARAIEAKLKEKNSD
jgi:hypothetical protein